MSNVIKKIGRKLARGILLLVGVSFLTFLLASASPIDPLQTNIGQAALGSMSAEQVDRLKAYWEVDTPIMQRYARWATGLLQGDWGTSLLYRRPVFQLVGERLENSLGMLFCAWIGSGFFGILFGVVSGANADTLPGKLIHKSCLILTSLPSFWLGLLFMMIFAVWLKVLPIGFSVPPGMEATQVTWFDQLRHAILPGLTLSVSGAASIALHTYEKMTEIMDSDYMLFAKARGEHFVQRILRHGLRNLMLPAVTLQFACISEIVGGSLLAEQVFSYPGLGQAAVAAGLGGDLPLLLGITMVCATLVFTGNLIADGLYGLIDPRMRQKRGLG